MCEDLSGQVPGATTETFRFCSTKGIQADAYRSAREAEKKTTHRGRYRTTDSPLSNRPLEVSDIPAATAVSCTAAQFEDRRLQIPLQRLIVKRQDLCAEAAIEIKEERRLEV